MVKQLRCHGLLHERTDKEIIDSLSSEWITLGADLCLRCRHPFNEHRFACWIVCLCVPDRGHELRLRGHPRFAISKRNCHYEPVRFPGAVNEKEALEKAISQLS